jgi:hypothetical protein
VEAAIHPSGSVNAVAIDGITADPPAIARHALERLLSQCFGLKYNTKAATAIPPPTIHVALLVGQNRNIAITIAAKHPATIAFTHHWSGACILCIAGPESDMLPA